MSPRPEPDEEEKTARAAARTFVLALAILVLGAWERDLFDADEGRYASVAWAMAESGDYVTPRLDDMPFMDKPPLVYWIQASLFEVFGPVELAARAPTLLAGALWCWLIFLLAARWSGSRRAGTYAALLAATSCAGMIGARVGPQMDMPLAAAVAGAIYAGWRQIERPGPIPAIGLGFAVGLGLLIKGPLAVAVPFLVALAWGLGGVAWRRVLRAVASPWTWGVALAIAAPWYVLVERAQPGWIAHFITYEHFGRFSRGDHRAFNPFWFYVPVALIYMAPWTPLAWGGGLRPGRRLVQVPLALFTCSPWSPRPWRAALGGRPRVGTRAAPVPAARLAWLWFLVAFVLYSLATRKLLNYLLPAAAPLFVLLGARAAHELERGAWRAWILPSLLGAAGLVAAALLGAGLWFPLARGLLPADVEAPRYAALAPRVLASGLVLLAALAVRRRVPAGRLRAASLIGAVALFWWCLDLGLARVDHLGSARRLAEAIAARADDHVAVVAFKRYPQGLGFYGAPPIWIAGGTPGAWYQREIVAPYADPWWAAHRSHEFDPALARAASGLLTSEEFDVVWERAGVDAARSVLVICRWREVLPLRAQILAGPFAGAARTDLFLVRPPARDE